MEKEYPLSMARPEPALHRRRFAAVDNGMISVAGALYDIETGEIAVLET